MNDIHETTGQPVDNIYQTGSTQPPKSKKGILAFLLVAVIFLTGLVSALSLVNIRLTHQLEQLMEPELCTVAFSADLSPAEARIIDSPFGFVGSEISDFWREYDRLPQGLYITQVDATRQAALLGICPGDILMALDGCRVSQWDVLNSMVSSRAAGEQICLTIYRNGIYEDIVLTLYE